MKKKIVVLISGNGTNLQSIIDSIDNGELKNARLVKVISSTKNAYGLKRVSKDKQKVISNNELLFNYLKNLNADLIVLAGYMKILPPKFINEFENKIINIHPSLLPKYSGKGMYGIKIHKEVLKNKEIKSGATVHFVDKGIDTGKIIIQKTLSVKENDSPKTLQNRILENIEHKILPKAIQKVLNSNKESMNYKKAGVDVEAVYKVVSMIKNLVKQTHSKNVLENIGSFASLFDISKLKIDDPVLVSGTDGVGTKLKLAFQLNKHSTIGQDLVAMCVNDIVCVGAKPLFFLDYIALSKNVPTKVAKIVKGIAKACKSCKCALVGGETAEMPNMYKTGEYDLAGFCVGVVSKSKIINKQNVKNNDILIGLKSSGAHSNGFSLIRRIYGYAIPENIAKKLLTPTKIYVNSILELLKKVDIKSVAHITGGGFYENIPRAIPNNLGAIIDKNSWKIPKLFNDIQKKGNISEKNMFNTFNMGIGMVIVISLNDKKKVLKILESENPVVIGKVTNKKGVEFI